MTEHPITMSAESIRAIQAGIKHETRRPVKPQPEASTVQLVDDGDRCWRKEPSPDLLNGQYLYVRCPYGQPGDRLWVRETWMPDGADCRYGMMQRGEIPPDIVYKADSPHYGKYFKWRPSIFMPRWASRFILPLVEVRAERLWDITKEGALAEGVDTLPWNHGDAVEAYERWWNTIYAKTFPWSSNPWVWVLGWEQVEGRE
jgi:hypothetical protein